MAFQEIQKHNGAVPKYSIDAFAPTISSLINSSDHMVHIKPETVAAYGKHNLAVWATLPGSEEFCGFVKALPWHPNLTGVQGGMEMIEEAAIQNVQNGFTPTGIESGSLIVPDHLHGKYIGYQLKEALALHAFAFFPGVPLFSVVDITNKESVGLNKKQGWKQLIQGVDVEQIDALMEKVGVDIIQGWDKACIFLHPTSYKALFGPKGGLEIHTFNNNR